jgi:hypothetical protein
MPVRLKKIEAEGMLTLDNTASIFEGDMLIDRPVSVRFAGADGRPSSCAACSSICTSPTTRSRSTW